MKVQFLCSLLLLGTIVSAQQNEYKLVFDTVEIVSYNKDIIENPNVVLYKYNDSSQAVNCSGVLKTDLGSDIKASFDAQKLQDNNEYKTMYSMNDVDLCDLLNRNVYGLKDLLQYGNFTTCPWKANTYGTYNAMIDVSKLPPKAPLGKYLVNVHYFSGTTEILHTKFAGSVVPKS